MDHFFNKHIFSLGKIMSWVMLFSYAGFAMADGLPWEGPLCGLVNGFRGPTALAISTIAFIGAACSFMWGEELTGILKKLVTVMMAVCLLIGALSFVGWIALKMGAAVASCSA